MQRLRILLIPFAWIYGIITFIRNGLYDYGFKKEFKIPKKSICVGNLAVGGTGKTPHVAYLTKLLKDKHQLSILSRGYGRKTNGFLLADENSTAFTIGDEPLLYYKRFSPKVKVTVCEKRVEGVQKINQLFPENELIILDDAFQHRAVRAGLNIIITDYNELYSSDFMLPAGNLREWKIGRKRADLVIVSKCPSNLEESKKLRIKKELKFNSENIYFSNINYGKLVSFGKEYLDPIENVLLVTGIANPKPLLAHLKSKYKVEIFQFSDHHEFTSKDIEQIQQKFDTFAQQNKVIITTEKDFVRLSSNEYKNSISTTPWFYQEIEIEIDKKEAFNKYITNYVDSI
ncbi:MAG: tetraacyldisaccharide 4'-kinase [Fluviicola sp.]|jgi:tetraacyldisaccharide 4'-kinase|nr:tetraacyldisaccharide 4'-kinase [Fluviicola sp.]